MLNYKNKGYVIEIDLPEECGHTCYSVECKYIYRKSENKYALSMWLKRKDVDANYKIESQEIDTQLISGTKDNIKENICRIVEQASLSGFFEKYIQDFEYIFQCFDKGNEFFEKERLDSVNAS